MKFDRIPEEVFQKTEPLIREETVKEAPEAKDGIESESSPEARKEKIMENARERRLGILGKTYDRVADTLHISPPAKRLISWLVNLTPVSAPKMIVEGIRGETFGGEKLKPYDRVMHLSIQALNIVAWGMGLWELAKGTNAYDIPGKIYAGSWALWAVYELPKILENSKDLVAEKGEKTVEFLKKMSQLIKKPDTERVGEPSPELLSKMTAEAGLS